MRPSNNIQNLARLRVALILALVGLMSAATLALGPARLVSAQTVVQSWSYTGNLNTGRAGHTATLLQNGKVLVAAGDNCFRGDCFIQNSPELYDSPSGTWSYTGSLNTARMNHTATLLPNGKVLVVGGLDAGDFHPLHVAARARALRAVAENSAFAQQEFNKAFVLMKYLGYLRRNPNDPPEPTLDFQGYNFWLTKLNQFNGSFQNAEMVKAFLVSTEYRQRFGQP